MTKFTVLLIDDSQLMRRILRELVLRVAPDCDVVEASNGQEGLVMALAMQPQLILLDYSMPLMNGADVVNSLRHTQETQEIPLVMVTGEQLDDPYVQRMFGLCEHVLSKPVPWEQLQEIVGQAAQRWLCENVSAGHRLSAMSDCASITPLLQPAGQSHSVTAVN